MHLPRLLIPAWAVSLILVVLLALASGCGDSFLTTATGGALGGGDKTEEVKEEVKEKVDVDLEVDDETTAEQVALAKRELAENFEAFLEREPLGFRRSTFDRVVPELQRAWRRATRAVDVVGDTGVRNSAPALVIALLLLALAFLDRELWRVAMRWQGAFYTSWWDWFTTWGRIFITVGGRAAPVLVVIALSYFPIQAVFGRVGWSLAVTAIFWLILAYRALFTTMQGVFAFGLVHVSDEDAKTLRAFARRSLRLIFGMLSLVVVVTYLEVADDVRSLLVFTYEVVLLTIPIYLLVLKQPFMELFPEADEPGIYARLRDGVDRYFRIIIALSVILLGLRAAGFVNASTFILLRSYGLFLLVIAVAVGGARLSRWMTSRVADATEEQQETLRSLEWVMRIVSVIFLVWAALALFELWGPLVLLLKAPLLSIGEATISAYSIAKAILFFLFTVFFARVVRAILTLKVFPAFGVDVGVGYAIQTLVSYAVILVGFFIALVALGVNLSAMTVVLASLGVGIGFGLQTLTENLISGFILLFGRSVKKGDIVTVGDTYGQVEAVGARSVLIKTADNYDLLIPSKEIVGGRIINWSYENTLIRQKVPVGVTYSADPREVERLLLEAASRHPMVLETPKAEVWFTGFGDSAINFFLLVWFDCRAITRDRLMGQLYFHIWDVLKEADIEIPFPQRDLHLRSIDFADELRRDE